MNLKIIKNDWSFDNEYKLILPIDNIQDVSFSYDGGRVSVCVNSKEVYDTFSSHDVSIEVSLTEEECTQEE